MLAFLMDEVAPWVMFSSSLSEDQFNKVSEDLLTLPNMLQHHSGVQTFLTQQNVHQVFHWRFQPGCSSNLGVFKNGKIHWCPWPW